MQGSPHEQVYIQNNNRILQLYSRTASHLLHLYQFYPNYWIIKKSRDIGIQIQNTLVSTLPYYKYKLYPCGIFDCATCHNRMTMDETSICYYEEESSGFICHDCKTDMSMPNVTILEGFHNMEKIDVPNMFMVDECMNEKEWEEYMEEKREVARKAANAWGATYLNNWSIEDLRWRRLAKRGVQAFQRNREKRLREKTFRALYHLAGMDIHAALVLAKQIKI